jgi:hypothetical protein
MPRNPIDSVEIVEPPIRELTKTRSSFKRGCVTGCFFILILGVATVGGIKFLIGAGPSTFKSVPSIFPKDIPIYDKDAIEAITFIPGKYKYRSTEIAAFFPKILLSPIILRIQGVNAPTPTTTEQSALRGLWRMVSTPVSDLSDTIHVEWKNIDAEPTFVYSYYKKELTKKDYAITNEVRSKTEQRFLFSREDGINGFLLVEGDEETKPGTDYAALMVNIPHKLLTSPSLDR